MRTADLKTLWSLLDLFYDTFSESDPDGIDQRNNISYYPAQSYEIYEDFFDDIQSLKDIIEIAIGKAEVLGLTDIKTEIKE